MNSYKYKILHASVFLIIRRYVQEIIFYAKNYQVYYAYLIIKNQILCLDIIDS